MNDICHGRAGAEVIQPMLEAFEVCFYTTEILVAGHHSRNFFSISKITNECFLVPFFNIGVHQNFTFQKRKLTDFKIIMRDDFVDLENEVRNLLPEKIANIEGRLSAQRFAIVVTSEYPGNRSYTRCKLSSWETGGLAYSE